MRTADLFRGLHPGLIPWAAWLYDAAQAAGQQPRITSVRRSRQRQAQLYELYLKGKMPYTVLPPGQSRHEIGYAFDMVVKNPELVGSWWRSVGGHWAGPTDPVHFEYRG